MEQAGATWIGLGATAEAESIRLVGIQTPIFLLYGPEPDEAGSALALDVESAVWRDEQVYALSEAALQRGTPARIHVLVEISRNWLGVQPGSLDTFCRMIAGLPFLDVRGVCAHVWNAHDLEAQITCFEEMARRVQVYFPAAHLLHIANSTAMLGNKRSHFDIVRPGIALYGIGDSEMEQAMQIEAMLQTVVDIPAGTSLGYGNRVAEEAGRLGILPLGYSHGLDPRIVNGGVVLLAGRRCPIVSVGMGMTTINLSLFEHVPEPGAPACLLGTQGLEQIRIEEIAAKLGVTPYEVVTRFCAALPRV